MNMHMNTILHASIRMSRGLQFFLFYLFIYLSILAFYFVVCWFICNREKNALCIKVTYSRIVVYIFLHYLHLFALHYRTNVSFW